MAKGQYKRVEVTPELLVEFMKEGSVAKCVDGLPQDAEMAGAGHHMENDVFYILVESDEYKELQEAEYIPEVVPEFEALPQEVDSPQAPTGDYPAQE